MSEPPTTTTTTSTIDNDVPPEVKSRHAHFADDSTNQTKNDNDTNDNESESEEEDDEEALERMKAFQRSSLHTPSILQQANNHLLQGTVNNNNSNTTTTSSIRRFDEYGDFITRSERAHSQREEPPLTPQELTNRKVGFVESITDLVVPLPELTKDVKQSCYMTAENWNNIDLDIEVTRKRWQNHCDGSMEFDVQNNSIRGLETMLGLEDEKDRDKLMYQHRKHVLQEQVRQKLANEYPNFEKFRKASLKHSTKLEERARQRGINDACDCQNLDCPTKQTKTKNDTNDTKDNRKKKGHSNPLKGFMGLFQSKKR